MDSEAILQKEKFEKLALTKYFNQVLKMYNKSQ